MKKLKGFTLTELMIALAVLGILVAVVTPAIMKTRPDKTKFMVKKAYYTTQDVVSKLINDPSLYPDNTGNCCAPADVTAGKCAAPTTDTPCFWGFDDKRQISHNGSQTTNAYGQTLAYADESKFLLLFADSLNVKSADSSSLRVNSITTNDGISWIFFVSNQLCLGEWKWYATPGTPTMPFDLVGVKRILVDVNGIDNPPNCCQKSSTCACTACSDPTDFDRFRIIIYPDGRLQIDPEDALASEYVTLSTSVRN